MIDVASQAEHTTVECVWRVGCLIKGVRLLRVCVPVPEPVRRSGDDACEHPCKEPNKKKGSMTALEKGYRCRHSKG